MIFISICLLMAPGLIALKICYSLTKKDNITIKNSIADYVVVSFFILMLVYLLLYITYPLRTISFNINEPNMMNNIYQASFVAKYAVASLCASLVTGFGYTFTKMNPFLFLRELKKELKKEKLNETKNLI